jgi:hypothetical protein
VDVDRKACGRPDNQKERTAQYMVREWFSTVDATFVRIFACLRERNA